MTLSNIGNDVFIGDSAATSHMTNNKTGVYELTPNKRLSHDRKWREHQWHTQRKIRCNMQAQGWINGQRDVGSKGSPSIEP